MNKTKLGPKPLLYPTPVVLVGTVIDDKINYMTVAWCGIAASNPPAISVGINKHRYTYSGVTSNKEFSVNVPSSNLVKEVDSCGLVSGKNTDKSKMFKNFFGSLKNAPLIQECPINLECKLIETIDLKSHTLFIGEIIECHVSNIYVLNDDVDGSLINPLIYSNGIYQRIGETIGKAFSIGK
jgi:flavin reductase (DIM6/NTAB) family NADH-FMN oxidoreductase RutF